MYLKAHEVAELAGISKNTLLRWLKAGKVQEVARDRNGWRVFSEEDVARVRAFAGKITPPEDYARIVARPGASAPDVSPARCAGPDASGEAA